jgi:hypothetical protein
LAKRGKAPIAALGPPKIHKCFQIIARNSKIVIVIKEPLPCLSDTKVTGKRNQKNTKALPQGTARLPTGLVP